MRVAFLTHEPFFPPSGGGSAEAVYLVEEMISRGHEVHLYCPAVADPKFVREKFNVHLHQFTAFRMGRYAPLRNVKYLLYPFFLRKMVEESARRLGFDFILSQHAIAAVTAGQLKRSLGTPVIQNFLDYLTGFMETWPVYAAPPPALALLKKFELNMPRKYQVDGIMTVSDTLADYFAGAGYPREKILPIYYGYDSELFKFHPRSATPPEAPVVVMHGSLDQHHLKTIALDAIEIVAKEMPSTLFKFVGHRTATLTNFLKKLQARAPQAKVESSGFVPYAEVARHLQNADIGIVPYEQSVGTHCAFVAKIVEYLGVGLRVVSARLNSATRYFGKEPMVRFTDFSGADFGRAIVEMLRNTPPNLPELARAASERVRRELDWRAISRKAIDFCERTAKEKGRDAS